jgi:hypothetical protein
VKWTPTAAGTTEFTMVWTAATGECTQSMHVTVEGALPHGHWHAALLLFGRCTLVGARTMLRVLHIL